MTKTNADRFVPRCTTGGFCVWDTALDCAYRDRGSVKLYRSRGKAQIRAAQASRKWSAPAPTEEETP